MVIELLFIAEPRAQVEIYYQTHHRPDVTYNAYSIGHIRCISSFHWNQASKRKPKNRAVQKDLPLYLQDTLTNKIVPDFGAFVFLLVVVSQGILFIKSDKSTFHGQSVW